MGGWGRGAEKNRAIKRFRNRAISNRDFISISINRTALVHTCVLAVITYRKIDKKQRVNKVKCVKQIKQNFPQRLGLVCLKVKP